MTSRCSWVDALKSRENNFTCFAKGTNFTDYGQDTDDSRNLWVFITNDCNNFLSQFVLILWENEEPRFGDDNPRSGKGTTS